MIERQFGVERVGHLFLAAGEEGFEMKGDSQMKYDVIFQILALLPMF